MSETALGLHFTVEIDDGRSLGDWTKCEGLSVEWDLYEYKEGGVNDYVHRLTGRAKYPNLKLTRPLTKATADVIKWLEEVSPTQDWPSAKISVRDAAGEVVATWTVGQVRPVKWQGPTLDVSQNQFATEVLELAHSGFLGWG
jgi:phage tail-like protein